MKCLFSYLCLFLLLLLLLMLAYHRVDLFDQVLGPRQLLQVLQLLLLEPFHGVLDLGAVFVAEAAVAAAPAVSATGLAFMQKAGCV